MRRKWRETKDERFRRRANALERPLRGFLSKLVQFSELACVVNTCAVLQNSVVPPTPPRAPPDRIWPTFTTTTSTITPWKGKSTPILKTNAIRHCLQHGAKPPSDKRPKIPRQVGHERQRTLDVWQNELFSSRFGRKILRNVAVYLPIVKKGRLSQLPLSVALIRGCARTETSFLCQSNLSEIVVECILTSYTSIWIARTLQRSAIRFSYVMSRLSAFFVS